MQKSTAPGRIVHLASYGGPYAGSFVPMLSAAATAAGERGYETTICFSELALDRPWLTDLSQVAEIRFLTSKGVRGNLRELKALLDEASGVPTVLHTHFGMFDEAAAVSRLWRPRLGVLWHNHSGRSRRIRMRTKAHGAVFGRLVNAVLCVSPEIYEEALAHHFPRRKLRQFPNAVDPGRFSPITAQERASARRALGLSPDANVVLHFGWDWYRKGGDRLVAAADLMASDPELTFLTVLGEGASDAPLKALSGHPTVRPLPPSGNVNELYAAADVFVNCSRGEGMPYAVLEALARGLPVLATDLPVARELLDGLPGAEVVLPGPEPMSSALGRMLAFSPAKRAEHAAAARSRIASTYALEPWSHRLVGFYEEALGAGRRR